MLPCGQDCYLTASVRVTCPCEVRRYPLSHLCVCTLNHLPGSCCRSTFLMIPRLLCISCIWLPLTSGQELPFLLCLHKEASEFTSCGPHTGGGGEPPDRWRVGRCRGLPDAGPGHQGRADAQERRLHRSSAVALRGARGGSVARCIRRYLAAARVRRLVVSPVLRPEDSVLAPCIHLLDKSGLFSSVKPSG